MIRCKGLSAACALGLAVSLPVFATESPEQWYADGQAAIAAAIALKPNTRQAKNVILFVGDGMGISTITATRIFDGQSRGESGEENVLAWEALPFVALSKTYNTNLQTPDSAGTMSAMMTGVKTDHGVLSVDQRVVLGDCASVKGTERITLLEQAETVGMATGVVSTARITHATPAATYAHSAARDWESDSDLPAEAKTQGCKDIARQLVEFNYGDGIEVVLGGGRRNFLPAQTPDPEYGKNLGKRQDGRNLIAEWQRSPSHAFVWNAEQLAKAAANPKVEKLLGLFSPSHMAYEVDRPHEAHPEPTLAAMTRTAIDLLAKREQGFFLMVEGGRIDHAHHENNAARALAEGQAFSQAVAAALQKVDLADTLVIVTADHSHVFTMGGYPARGNPILGFVRPPVEHAGKQGLTLALDKKPYTTLGYLNGPGYSKPEHRGLRSYGQANAGRKLDATVDVEHADFHQEVLIPLASETHGGEDVAIFAGGPWAHLFHRTHEQNYIYHVMYHALGMHERIAKQPKAD
ncbi:alkaline phosphatase [Simiduia sp. 21SJ11W-1]|uniref:alkaline phosphatase n=1 Tax=Simiduia sp. 21SJ11W-1 TaxID=2909669 RepID=UPI00209F3E85|nr:alkaline phosphatase [Simiduia sp. 21SJ11W-1]UTA48906.1 alkaline phosphatase [Simiduia sp. 21SJ11W-1]